MTLSIFDRCGQLIYISHDKETGWNGMYASQKASSGVYVYYLKIKTITGGSGMIARYGDITLINK